MDKITINIIGEFEHPRITKKVIHEAAIYAVERLEYLDPNNTVLINIDYHSDQSYQISFSRSASKVSVYKYGEEFEILFKRFFH